MVVSVKLIRNFLSNFTFFTIGEMDFSFKKYVRLIKKFVRKEIKKIPIIAHLLQCLTGLSSIPSFKALINFSALSLSLYSFKIFPGSSSTELSRMKNLSTPVI